MVPTPIISLFDGKIKVYLYGVFIAIGILACFGVFFFFCKKRKIPEIVQDFMFICAIVAIALGFLFAKLYQAFYDLIETGVFDFYGAGITAMGGFIGGAVVFILVYLLGGKLINKKHPEIDVKNYFFDILCIAPLCILIAHAFGRLGCLMAGCCHGAYLGKEYVFGGIYMRASDTGVWGYYVPTQLYESLFLFTTFLVLSVMFYKGNNFTMPLYLISYGVWRIVIEFFRTDERGAVLLGLAPSQWQSVIFILGGVALIVIFIMLKIPFWKKQKVKENEKS